MSSARRVIHIVGSLRQAAFNRAARELAPEAMQIDSLDIAPIPLYNEDNRSTARRSR